MSSQLLVCSGTRTRTPLWMCITWWVGSTISITKDCHDTVADFSVKAYVRPRISYNWTLTVSVCPWCNRYIRRTLVFGCTDILQWVYCSGELYVYCRGWRQWWPGAYTTCCLRITMSLRLAAGHGPPRELHWCVEACRQSPELQTDGVEPSQLTGTRAIDE